MHDDLLGHGHSGSGGVTFAPIADDDFPVNPDWLRLTSVGIDIGSSTSHLMFSKLIMRRLNFVDLGEPLESVEAIPVVVKSLVFDR